jgi:hypothetical protein
MMRAKEQEFIFELERKISRQRRMVAWVAIAAASAAMTATIAQYYSTQRAQTESITRLAATLPDVSPDFRKELDGVKLSVKEVKATLDSLSAAPAEPSAKIALARTDESMKLFGTRLAAIEAAIQESPEKALSIPLIRKDLSQSEKRIEEIHGIMKADIDRLYDQNRWILGGIGTVLVTVIAGAAGIIFKTSGKNAKKEA